MEHEAGWTDADRVAVRESNGMIQPSIVHERSILAVKILEYRVARCQSDARMTTRHARRRDDNGYSRVSSDHHFGVREHNRALAPYKAACARDVRGLTTRRCRVDDLNGRDEPVAAAGHRLDISRTTREVANRATDLFDRFRETVVEVDEDRVRPETRAKFLAAHHIAVPREEHRQHFERLRLQLHLHALAAKFSCS